MPRQNLVRQLEARGVRFLAPESIYIAPEVRPERFAAGSVIYPGCRLLGADLSLGADCVIGAEAPVTLDNCQLGAEVTLAGGYLAGSTFLQGFKAGSGAHVRPACLFEEHAVIAHSTGVKQTIFMPWVMAGSLVNFCDALVSGGSGPQAHSEIGSSYVHFNFTPRQDKATASLVGDVPRGVLLNQEPIFLGGQGGLVGPTVIAYGTVLAAGQVWRGDILEPGYLMAKPAFKRELKMPYKRRQYAGLQRIMRNNLLYIGNLMALDMWYRVVRHHFMQADATQRYCWLGARQRLAEMLTERVMRLEQLIVTIERSLVDQVTLKSEQQLLVTRWPTLAQQLQDLLAWRLTCAMPQTITHLVAQWPRHNYLQTIQALSLPHAHQLHMWLQTYVTQVLNLWE